jgi:hypothetical protein
MPRWYSIHETAQLLGFDDDAVHEAIALRQLQTYKHKTWAAPRVSADSLRWFAKRYNLSLSNRHPDAVTYFIQAGEGGPIKIGSAQYVGERLAALQTANAAELVVIGVTTTPEDVLHRRFNHLWIRGEWFRADDALLSEITRLCGPKLKPIPASDPHG